MNRTWMRYGLAIVAPAVGLALRLLIVGLEGELPTYITFYPAVMFVAVMAGAGPGLLATFLSATIADYLILYPHGGLIPERPAEIIGLALFSCMGVFMCAVAGLYHRAREKASAYRRQLALKQTEEELRRQKDLLSVTLASIGDAVLVTDVQARVTFLNPEAELLTGWSNAEAAGQPIGTVFNIISEETRQPAENPVEKVLRLGTVAGLANHTLLIARDGRETPIDDSGAPIRGADGQMHGVVLVFRDFTEQKSAEMKLRDSERHVRRKLDSILSPEGDIAGLHLKDIIDLEAVESLLTDFYTLVGLTTAILDLEGNVLVGVGWQDICTQFHRVHPETCQHCRESDTQLSTGIGPGEFRLYRCKNSMWDVATPIMVGGQHIGNLFSGQFFFDDEQIDLEGFRQQGAKYGFDEAQYLAALQSAPRLSRKTVDAAMSFLAKLSQTISLMSYSNIKLARARAEGDRLAAQLSTILENLDEGVVAADLDGNIFRWNRAALAMHDYASVEECRRKLPEFTDTFELSTLEGVVLPLDQWPLARILRGERLRDLELRIRHLRAGWVRVCNYGGTLVHDAEGRPLLAVVTINDISRRKVNERALRESQEDLNRAQAVAQTGSWRMDMQRNELVWSDENYRVFGIAPGTPLTYETFLSTVHPDDRAYVDRKWKAALQGEPYDIEHRIIRHGEVKWLRERAEVELDAHGAIKGGFGTSQDVTQRKVAEEALAAALTSADRAKAIAEEANQAKDHFLAVLSHELRTPLTPVLATVSALQAEGGHDAELHQSLEVIRRNVEMEARLIDDLLDVTRIARGKVELHRQPVALADIVHRALEVCQTDITARELKLRLDLDSVATCVLDADPARLQQVFWNLIKNAVKFSPRGGEVSICCRRDGDGHVLAEVADQGEGIDPEALARIFNAFEQADRTVTRQFGGLGLGLTISRTLVELHGGTIAAISKGPGQGALFRVRLPIVQGTAAPRVPSADQPESTSGTPASPSRPPTGRPRRVLLVEDHGDTARILSRLLIRRGYEVHTAGDVTTALEAAQQQTFDLLISDLGLPDRSGLELIGELRARGQTLPAIALSGYGQEEDVRRSRQAGFSNHLTKPVDFEHFYKAISAVLQ